MTHIAIFASGAGSNAREIINYFRGAEDIHVSLIVTNRPDAGVIKVARDAGIPVLLLEKERFFRGDGYIKELKTTDIDLIVLAGFLWKVPLSLIENYKELIINIHPALLPKFGGKGMYGNHVHEAVINAGEKESGITIHLVDELYDHGKTIFQARIPVSASDTPFTLAEKIHKLEHGHYPAVIEDFIQKSKRG
jgi:phosphoribosylglycinamide formyltransferase-1